MASKALYLVWVVDKRQRSVLLLDLPLPRRRRDAEDGKWIETLDLRVISHGVEQVEEASPPRYHGHQLQK